MGWYSRLVLPKLIDVACGQKPFTKLRTQHIPRASGDVLEIGIGSGLNLPHYSTAATSITGVDPSEELTTLAKQRAEQAPCPVNILGLSGNSIAAEDGRFDSIVCTWTLCTIPDVTGALIAMHRVLKSGGELFFIEHGLSPDAGVAKWQRRIEPLWKVMGGGCHLTRRPDDLLETAGFEITEMDNLVLPGPKIATYTTRGVAQKI